MAKKSNEPTVTINDTGIYRDGRVHVNAATHDEAALKESLKSLAKKWRAPTLDKELKRIHNNMAVGKADPREHIQDAAKHLSHWLSLLEKAIVKGDVRTAALCGILVGMRDERLQIRAMHEANAMYGRKSKVALSTGREKKAAEDAAFHKAVRDWVQAKMDGSKRLSLTGARAKAAIEFNRSVRHVLRITKGMKTPKRK